GSDSGSCDGHETHGNILPKFWGEPRRSDVAGWLCVSSFRDEPEIRGVVVNRCTTHNHANHLVSKWIHTDIQLITSFLECCLTDILRFLFPGHLIGEVHLKRQNLLVHVLPPGENPSCNPTVVCRRDNGQLMFLSGLQNGIP